MWTAWTNAMGNIYWLCRDSDHMDSMNRHNTQWATRPRGHYDHMDTWTALIDTMHGDALDHVINILWDTLTTWAIHTDHVDSIDWCNIWDTLWPHGHYMGYTLTTWAIHTDHVDSIDWCNIWDTLWPHGHYMGYTMSTWALYGIHSDYVGNTYWSCRQHRLIQHMDTIWPHGALYGIRSDHMGTI